MSRNGVWRLPVFMAGLLPFMVGGMQPSNHTPFYQTRSHFETDSITTETQYFQNLVAADSITFKYQFETEFLLLLDDAQWQEYQQQPSLLAKKQYILNYWKATNPNPLLEENDWLKDFLQRRRYVRTHYAISRPPFFDDRGKYYLKYGKPFRKYVDPAGYKKVDMDNIQQIRVGETTNRYINLRMNESWSYENIHRGFVVHFLKEGEGFREIDDLFEIVESVEGRRKYDPNVMAQIWFALVKQRSYLSHDFLVAEDKLRWINEGREHLRFGYDQVLAQPFFIKEAYEKRRRLAIKEAPHVAYDPVDAVNRLKFYTRISQFRAGVDSTRIDIVFLWPVSSRTIEKMIDKNQDSMRVVFSALFRNRAFDSVDRQEVRRRLPLAPVESRKLRYVVGEARLTAPPQTGELTVQVRDEVLNQLGFRRIEFRLRDFRQQVLLLSDVKFLADAEKWPQDLFPVSDIQNQRLIPYPYRVLRRLLPVSTYFEVYHLSESGGAHYEVEYKISYAGGSPNLLRRFLNVFSGRKTSISVRYERPIVQDTAHELLMLDLGQLKSGRYQMDITVRVPDTNAVATIQRQFELR
ncbi:MAG: GWxTD domain-containing protein [candidate division KSB1 bacterium]|nr:GWxTD domain-containing protein [candidate division KSB1 bacterium]MDQ7066477.1 GWxTD domain-containing protein [candidate division KSB1 bacterium]